MSSWFTDYLFARDMAEDRAAEAERHRLARASAFHGHAAPVPPALVRTRERPPLPTALTGARVRRWTLRLARVAVTVSLEPASRPEAAS